MNREQFLQIAKQQPVYAGNLINKKDTAELVQAGYVARDHSENYILTAWGEAIHSCILTRTVFYLNRDKHLTGCYFFGV